jgi:hypothetical protein
VVRFVKMRRNIDEFLADANWSQRCLQEYIAQEHVSDPIISEIGFSQVKHDAVDQFLPESKFKKETGFKAGTCPFSNQSFACGQTSALMNRACAISSFHDDSLQIVGGPRNFLKSETREAHFRRTYRKLQGVVSEDEQREIRRAQVLFWFCVCGLDLNFRALAECCLYQNREAQRRFRDRLLFAGGNISLRLVNYLLFAAASISQLKRRKLTV